MIPLVVFPIFWDGFCGSLPQTELQLQFWVFNFNFCLVLFTISIWPGFCSEPITEGYFTVHEIFRWWNFVGILLSFGHCDSQLPGGCDCLRQQRPTPL